jgi:hypothetical protein
MTFVRVIQYEFQALPSAILEESESRSRCD